ncbi:MAG: hypothetical protein COB07_10885 [Sulfurovum sp.]|nr:MAG: hypothetical protein COB07_10885 [Sulfurovum sp.]
MSDILFPAGLIVDYPSLDIEMMQDYVTMWNIEYKLLRKGVCEGSLWAAHTPRVQLGISHFSQEVMIQGAFPDGCIVLCYFSNGSLTDPVNNFHNRIIAPHEIIVLRKGDKLDFLTYTTVNFYTIVIEEKLFYKEFNTFFGYSPGASIKKKRLYLKHDHILLFHQAINSWPSYVTEDFLKLTNKPEYDKIESEILHQLFSCMRFAPAIKKRKKFQTKTVRDLLHKNIKKPIDMTIVIKEFNIGGSQVYNAFKKEYGITPKKYLKILRFNAIKKELLLADPKSVTISGIARKYHFVQMGHFAEGYKQQFGETPSQTLRHYQ